jgi:hypothetical protein
LFASAAAAAFYFFLMPAAASLPTQTKRHEKAPARAGDSGWGFSAYPFDVFPEGNRIPLSRGLPVFI